MLHLYLRRYPISLLLILAITLLSLLPIPDLKVGVDVPLADKWTHMVMYGVLTLAIWFEYKRSHRKNNVWRLLLFAFLAPIAMGGALELAQAYLTTCRSGEWLDFVANTIGVCIGTVGGLVMIKLKRWTCQMPHAFMNFHQTMIYGNKKLHFYQLIISIINIVYKIIN